MAWRGATKDTKGRFASLASLTERFMSKTTPEPNTGCWLWVGVVDRDGYGGLFVAGRGKAKATRVSLELAGRPARPGEVVRHSCDQPSCVNPGHLKAGTQKENIADAVARGRKAVGERHPFSTLSVSDVQRIRQLRAAGVPGVVVAREFGISGGTVSAVWTRRMWRHVE